LFVQDADEVTIAPVSVEQNSCQLILAGVGPELVYFADQPQRKAEMIDQADFGSVCKGACQENPAECRIGLEHAGARRSCG
jgi:hypothetical protein